MASPTGQGASSSQSEGQPRDPNSGWLSKVGFKLARPPKDQYSPHTDERCFTYCSQTAAGRTQRQEPWCRSICIRRVFTHEVRNLTGRDNYSGSSLYGKSQQAAHDNAKFALPPEGQRADEVPDKPEGESEGDKYEQKLREKGARYWEEGWYVWYSKSRWAAQEKVDLMMHDLGTQAAWYRHMAKQKVDWMEYERDGRGKMEWGEAEPPTMTIAPPRKPFPDPAKQSLLVHLPPPLPPIYDQIQTLLAPTFKVTSIFRESFESGGQRELAGRLWEKAWSGDPFLLAKNAARKIWKVWQDDDDNDP